MGVLEAIKKGFSVTFKNLGLVLVLIVFNLVWNLLSIPFFGLTPAVGLRPAVAVKAGIFLICLVLSTIFMHAGILGLLKDTIKAGAVKLANFVKYSTKYYLRLLGLVLVMFLSIIIIELIIGLIVGALLSLNNAVASGIAIALALIIAGIGIYFIILLSLAPYIMVADDTKLMAALKGSVKFVRKNLGQVLVLVILALIGFGLGLLMARITGLLTTVTARIVMGIINNVISALVTVIVYCAFMAFYLGKGQGASRAGSAPQA